MVLKYFSNGAKVLVQDIKELSIPVFLDRHVTHGRAVGTTVSSKITNDD